MNSPIRSNRQSYPLSTERFAPAPAYGAPPAGHVVEPAPGVSLIALLRRQWFPLMLTAVLGVVAAFYIADHYGSKSWNFTSTLLYNRSDAGAPEYVAPSLSTLTTIVTGHETLEALNNHYNLNMTPEELAKRINVHLPYSDNTLVIAMSWPSEAEGKELLNGLIDIFVDSVNESRRSAIEKYTSDYVATLEIARQSVSSATDAYLKFSREQGFVDVERDLERIQDEISAFDRSLQLAILRRENCQAQLDRLAGMQTSIANRLAEIEGGQPSQVDTTVPGQIEFDRQMHDYLQGRIGMERERLTAQAALELKRKEYERAKDLHEKKYISDAVFERIESEFNVLAAQQQGPVAELQNKLDQIEVRMPTIIHQEAMLSPSPTGLGRSIAEIQLDMIACEGEIEYLNKAIAAKRADLDRVGQIRQQAEEMEDDRKVAVAERQRVETLLAKFRQIQRADSHEFTISRPANLSAENPTSSNRSKLMLGAFTLVCLVLAAPIFGWELYSNRERPVQGAARRLGLPVLARRNGAIGYGRPNLASSASASAHEFPRLLALRIQQAMNKPGSVLLFSSLCERPATVSLLASSAHCFAQRGERVLLMDIGTTRQNRRELEDLIDNSRATVESHRNGDLRSAEDGPYGAATAVEVRSSKTLTMANGRTRGVADFVVDPDCDLHEIIQPTRIPGVDCIGPGCGKMPEEGLGTRRMTELLDQLRTEYSMVLVAGPTTTKPVDLAMLAARTDGIVFAAAGSRSANAQGEEVVRDLIDLDAPILGFVE